MPTFEQHFDQASRNKTFLDDFIFKKHHDWAVTVMFYTSLHLIEALMYKEVNRLRSEGSWGGLEIDCSNHDERDRQVKEILKEVHFPYTQLRKTADSGRYKVYIFRPKEVFVSYNEHFVPVVNFFNEYCKKYGLKTDFKMSKLTFDLSGAK